MKIQLYDTATRSKREFTPLKSGEVSIYCCGPTVYHDVHIGNMRTFLFADFLQRMFRYFNYKVTYVQNITDVGHLTSDADEGEDKMLKGAKRENKTVWDIAQMYTDRYLADATLLNIQRPDILPKATDHIQEMIAIIQLLEKKGFTYTANGNVYFDTAKFPDYAKFANLNLAASQQSRVGEDTAKKNKSDFVLWFTKSKFEDQAMKWDSPYGVGYPGWHIECSAMSRKYLGDTFDIHCGGHDLIHVHHTNEIAQSKCAGFEFAQYWMHGEFVIDETGKMSKSKGDFLTVKLLCEKGFDPIAYRYLVCQTHYRKQMKFSFEALESAQTALNRLKTKYATFKDNPQKTDSKYVQLFNDALSDDLNIPKALSVLQEMMFDESVLESNRKYVADLFDTVLGLDLQKAPLSQDIGEIPTDVQELLDQRREARQKKDFTRSDELRDTIKEKGYIVKDTSEGQVLEKA